MKSIAVCVVLFALATSSMGIILGNGRPGCKTDQELVDKNYRNLFDSTSYWVCSELNTPATLQRCDSEQAYQASLRRCVSIDDWEWEDPIAPLSVPSE